MVQYIATFFTHYDAMQFKRALGKRGIEATLMPVPRWLSSSCGTCAGFEAERFDHTQMSMDTVERLVSVDGDEKTELVDNR